MSIISETSRAQKAIQGCQPLSEIPRKSDGIYGDGETHDVGILAVPDTIYGGIGIRSPEFKPVESPASGGARGSRKRSDVCKNRQISVYGIQGKSSRIKTIAILSAENPMGAQASPEYNSEASEKLFQTLSSGHVIYFPTRNSQYQGIKENSCFVYNVSLDYAKFLADTFNQESMIFVDITSPDQISYQYWERSGEGKPLEMSREEHDIINATNDADNYTRICRRFKFRIPFFEGYLRTLTALMECPAQSDVDRMLTETTTHGYSGQHQYVTMAKLYGKWNDDGKCHIRENHSYSLSQPTRRVFNETITKANRKRLTESITENVMNKIKKLADTIPHYEGNFLEEVRGSETFNKAPLVSINETNAKRLLDRHTQNGYIAISPCRGFTDFGLDSEKPGDVDKLRHINRQRVQDCIAKIKASGFSYTPAYGGSIENAGTENEEEVFERTFIVYPTDKKGNPRPFEDLKKLAIRLANEYNQDDVLVVAPGEPPTYYKKDGSKGDVLGTNVSFNDLSQIYFTDLHKNTGKTQLTGKPTRFSYTECYINPGPECLSEAHCRYLQGEVCLAYKR
ncbi:MAG: DUF3293 domain-containing protein [Bacteroidales bacterium]|nr:DUF3293 domain-containing protein [Bacteroidales bacterium]